MELKICRACLERNASISVFEWQEGVQLCAKMMKCAAVCVAAGDGLPDAVCARCAAELARCFEFAARCEASDRTLRALHEPQGELFKREIKPDHDSQPQDSGRLDNYVDNDDSDNDNRDYENEEVYKNDNDEYLNDNDYENDHKNFMNDYTDSNVQAIADGNDRRVKYEVDSCEAKNSKKILPNFMRTRKLRLKTGPIQCLVCERVVPCHSAFITHMRTHTEERPYSCDICKKSFKTKDVLKKHIMRHYGIKEDKTKPKKSYNRKIKRPKIGPFQCTICGRLWSSQGGLDTHMRTHTGEKPFACEVCGTKYNLKGTLKRHMRCSHPDRYPDDNFVCEHCGKTFYARSNIIIHMRVHTGDKPFKCPYCPSTFSQQAGLIRHKRQHTGEKPYSCKTCGKSFCEPCVLKRHEFVHTNEKNFDCHICNRKYKTKHSLQAHVSSHIKSKTYVCSVCGLSISSKGNLKTHMRRMHSDKSGICSVCNKHFGNMDAHMVVHTGEKPYACKLCDQAYATQRSLSHHVGFKHRNCDKFKCTVDDCEKTFPTASMLEFHVLKAHTGSAPYACAHCARAFRRPSDLSAHLRRAHHIAHTHVRSRFIRAGAHEP